MVRGGAGGGIGGGSERDRESERRAGRRRSSSRVAWSSNSGGSIIASGSGGLSVPLPNVSPPSFPSGARSFPVVGAGLTGCAALLWVGARASSKHEKQLRSAKEMSIRDVVQGKHALPTLAVIKGVTAASEPSELIHSSNGRRAILMEVVKEVHFMKHNESSGEWAHDHNMLSRHWKGTGVMLSDEHGNGVPVVDANSASGISSTLTVAFDQMDVYDRNFTAAIRGTLDYIRGLRIIGIRTRERILPVGEKVTAIGEISMDPVLSQPVLKKPVAVGTSSKDSNMRTGPFYITKQTPEEIVAAAGSLSQGLRWFSYAMGLSGVFLIGVHVFQKWLLRRRIRLIAEERKQNLIAEEDENGGVASADEEQCSICFRNGQLNSVFANCGHMCCCYECATRMRACPLCRSGGRVIRVYR